LDVYYNLNLIDRISFLYCRNDIALLQKQVNDQSSNDLMNNSDRGMELNRGDHNDLSFSEFLNKQLQFEQILCKKCFKFNLTKKGSHGFFALIVV
jgi:hypothetical protein